MAFYKVKHPVIAPISSEPDNAPPVYGTGMVIGKAIQVSLTPNMNEASLYGDDGLAEYSKEFSDLDVSINTTNLPDKAHEMMFGETVSEDGSISSTTADEAHYVGFGCVVGEVRNNVTRYGLLWLPKVKFSVGSETYDTKGDSITWNTPTIDGKGTADNSGQWRSLAFYETEALAISALDTKAGIKKT